jgi:hypothetical protein
MKSKALFLVALIPLFAFLCPVVGDGVLNADSRNGDNGVSTITPPVGTSFLPGNNQAGANANTHTTPVDQVIQLMDLVETQISHLFGRNNTK